MLNSCQLLFCKRGRLSATKTNEIKPQKRIDSGFYLVAGAETCLDPFVEHAEGPYQDTSVQHWRPCCGAAGVGGVGPIQRLEEFSAEGA